MTQEISTGSGQGRTAVTITLALSMLLASLGTSIANIALPALAEGFAASFPQVQAVVVAYLAALTATVVIAGRLGDRYGAKPMLLAGLVLFTGASLACAAAPGLSSLIAARAIQGTGAAFLMTLSMALTRQTASPTGLGRAMGLLGTVSAFGTALGPALGGLLIPTLGWRSVFWAQVPLAAAALVLAFAVLPVGTARVDIPVASLRSVLDRRLVPNLVVNLLVAAVMMSTLVVGPFYLGLGLGLGETLVGAVMAVGPVISIACGVPAGRLVDRWGSAGVLAIGLTLLACGAFMLALLPAMIGISGYVVALLVLTPGYQLFQAANNTASLADATADRRGTISGLLTLARNIGLMTGASAMGTVFALGVGSGSVADAGPAAIATGMRLTFLLAGAMMIVATGIALGLRTRPHGRDERPEGRADGAAG